MNNPEARTNGGRMALIHSPQPGRMAGRLPVDRPLDVGGESSTLPGVLDTPGGRSTSRTDERICVVMFIGGGDVPTSVVRIDAYVVETNADGIWVLSRAEVRALTSLPLALDPDAYPVPGFEYWVSGKAITYSELVGYISSAVSAAKNRTPWYADETFGA